jgi:hypothetical protein
LAVAGCTTYDVRGGTRPATNVVLPATQARMDNVGILSAGLERRVAVQNTGAQRTPTNTLEVSCTFRNRTNFDQKLQVRVQFYSEERIVVERPGAWQVVHIPANSIETCTLYSTETTRKAQIHDQVRFFLRRLLGVLGRACRGMRHDARFAFGL